MSGSGRNSKSLWDMKEEREPTADISENNDWPGIERRSSSHGWPSREPSQGNSGVHKDDSINRGRKNSPAFDQRGRQKDSCSPDDSWNLSHRDRGRSRSRSRSRRTGRDNSRSRSRSRSRGRARDQIRSRSRSPFNDHRRESFGRMDRRRIGTGIASQPCKYFAAGRCNKGNQCKFFHQDNPNYRDRDDRNSENDPAERWRTSRTEHGRGTKFGNSNDKETNCCNDFLRGRCHRGASCRYPHHGASGDNYDRGNRNVSYDHDRNRQQKRGGPGPCKYFLMGKCHKDDCRFSHDGPASDNLDGRSRDDRWACNFDEKKKSWGGPTWDDAAAGGVSDIAKSSTGWGGGSVGNTNFHDPSAAERRTDHRQGHNLDEKRKSWNDPPWDGAAGFSDTANPSRCGDSSVGNEKFDDTTAAEKTIDDRRGHKLDEKTESWNGPTWDDVERFSDIAKSSGWGDGSGGNGNFHDPVAAGKQSDDRWDHNLEEKNKSLKGPSPGDTTGILDNFHDQTAAEERTDDRWDQSLENESRMWCRPDGPDGGCDVDFENTEFMGMKKLNDREEIQPISQGSQSRVLDDVSIHVHAQNLLQQISYIQQQQGQGGFNISITGDSKALNQNGYSIGPQPPSSLNVINQSLPILSLNPSNGHNIDLNDLVQPILSPSNRQDQSQIPNEEAVKTSEKLEFRVPQVPPQFCQNVVTSEEPAQMTNLPASFSWISPNGQQLPQPYMAVNPPIDSTMIQPILATRPQVQPGPTSDNMKPNKTGNSSKSSEKEYHKSPELKKQEPVESSKVNGDTESKQDPKNIHSGSVDGQGKVEESNSSKDEKAMRLFKVALVEFVKEILKPKWKEGQMSREVHKTIVKKTVDKVTSTIQGDLIPKTQDKIEQYLAFSKGKITKLVQAYVERFLKN